jgi:hypothetical protein
MIKPIRPIPMKDEEYLRDFDMAAKRAEEKKSVRK